MSKMQYIESCIYHATVGCNKEGRKCDKCGWNPKVDAERREKLRKKMEGKA